MFFDWLYFFFFSTRVHLFCTEDHSFHITLCKLEYLNDYVGHFLKLGLQHFLYWSISERKSCRGTVDVKRDSVTRKIGHSCHISVISCFRSTTYSLLKTVWFLYCCFLRCKIRKGRNAFICFLFSMRSELIQKVWSISDRKAAFPTCGFFCCPIRTLHSPFII